MSTESPVTGGVYSRDNHDFSLAVFPERNGDAGWVAWSAYEAAGSRCFVRPFDGEALGALQPLSDSTNAQFSSQCLAGPEGVLFVWLEKAGKTYSVHARRSHGGSLGPARALHRLPEGATAGELHGECDQAGAVWLAWGEANRGVNSVSLLRTTPDGNPRSWELSAGGGRDFRPRLAPLDDGVFAVWDAYDGETYDVYGCEVRVGHAGEVHRISNDRRWENRASVCRDRDGRIWCVWVRAGDVVWQNSVVHQRHSVRGARYCGTTWSPIRLEGSGADLALLHYGLLTDLERKPPALGHQGHRLRPMLRAAADGGVWLFWESKADDAVQTLESRGRLSARHLAGGGAASPVLQVAEGLVRYQLPHTPTVGSDLPLLGRSIEQGRADLPVDEIVLCTGLLGAGLPEVPEHQRAVDLTHWREVDLPFGGLSRHSFARTQLAGEADGCYSLLWGDFHVHSVGSVECEGELDELVHYARDKACLHALTISDNDHFWNETVRGNQRWLSDHEWDANVGNARAMNEPGRFLVFPGYEQTIGGATLDIGRRLLRNHTSVMAECDDMERDLLQFEEGTRRALAEGRRSSCKDIVDCVEWARRKGYFPLPHAHVNWWRVVDAAVQTSCDVTAAWMRNIERFDIYETYLREGVKFGFTGSSDAHYRNPGLGGAVTGLWVEEFSRAGVLAALRARRTYATAGARILVELAVNDTFMGGQLVVTEDPVIRWRVAGDPDGEYRLRVRRDGCVVHELSFRGEHSGEFLDDRLVLLRQGKHYYALEVESVEPIPDYPSNVAHALGGKAWSTPVWLETADWIVA